MKDHFSDIYRADIYICIQTLTRYIKMGIQSGDSVRVPVTEEKRQNS